MDDNVIKQCKNKRSYLIGAIDRMNKQVNDEAKFLSWDSYEIDVRLQKLEKLEDNFQEVICQFDCKKFGFENENEKTDDAILDLKAKFLNRLEALKKQNNTQTLNVQTQPLQIEIQQTDATGNVPNTWGTFNGDYSKWKSFHDRWVAAMHDNAKIKTIIKFQNLKTACIGDAEGALGEWDLTDDNYPKAWERLKTIYEDDYMQVQEFMRKLNKMPEMQNSSSKSIREVIDTVHKHIHGIKRYVETNEAHPYVVFTVIDRMDTETYRSWEKYRSSLASTKANNTEANDNSILRNKGKHIPSWDELERFLEGEVTIRVHAEKQNATNTLEDQNSSKSESESEYSSENEEETSDSQDNYANEAKCKYFEENLQCVLCNGNHSIHKCESFKAMSLNGRMNHIKQYNLCERCLCGNHDGQCARKQNNEECPKCKPEIKYHNGMICPNMVCRFQANNYNSYKSGKRKYESDSDSNSE